MNPNWISFHIFYSGSLDTLLDLGIRPIFQQLLKDKAADAYFFVRYWNGGPHIRLRLNPVADSVTTTMAAKQKLEHFIAMHPGGNRAHGINDGTLRMQQFLSRISHDWNNQEPEPIEIPQASDSVQLRPYDFDSKRYGGVAARTITEAHFCRSSELATAVVAHSIGRMEVRFYLAFQMMAMIPYSLDLPQATAIRLFSQSSQILRFMYPEMTKDFISAFGFVPFEEQKSNLVALVEQTRAHLPDLQVPFANALFRLWKDELELCRAELFHLWESQNLSCHPTQIMMDYLHLLCNRLGISYEEECYLHYLIVRTLEIATTQLGGE